MQIFTFKFNLSLNREMILVPSAPVLARPLMWEKLLCVVNASQISNDIVF